LYGFSDIGLHLESSKLQQSFKGIRDDIYQTSYDYLKFID
jgi:hypothetical protein